MNIRELYTELKKLSETYGNKYVGIHLADKNELMVDEPLSTSYTLTEYGLSIYMANDYYHFHNAYPKTLMNAIQEAVENKVSDNGKIKYSAVDLLEVFEYPVYIINGKDMQVGDDCSLYDDFEIVPCLDECTQPKSEIKTYDSFGDLKVLVDNAAYYKTMKHQIHSMKDKPIEDIIDFLEKLPTYSKINFTEEYLDFNWQGMTLSIYLSSGGYYLGDTIDMWNDKTCMLLGIFNNVGEVESAIKESADCIIDQLENLKGHYENFCNDDESIWKKNINALNIAIDCIKEFLKGKVK